MFVTGVTICGVEHSVTTRLKSTMSTSDGSSDAATVPKETKDGKMDADKMVNMAREKLFRTLGQVERQYYYANLRGWFRRIYDREDFDRESRRIMNTQQLVLHNDLIMAIMNKLLLSGSPFYDLSDFQAALKSMNMSNQPYMGHMKRHSNGVHDSDTCNLEDEIVMNAPRESNFSDGVVFHPVDLYSYVPEEDYPESGLLCLDPSLSQPRKATQELFLPDPGSILGRLLVAAWEQELVIIDDDVRDYIVMGVQILLKNILTAVIKTGKSFRASGSERYFFDVGCPYADPFLKNSIKRMNIDADDLASDLFRKRREIRNQRYKAACEVPDVQHKGPTIQVRDLYFALKDHSLIPAHSVRAITLERVTARLKPN